MCTNDIEFNFKQIRKNTCGISVCRAIIYYIKDKYISEVDILEEVKNLKFKDNSWKSNFLKNGGSMPTKQLQELLSKRFSIELELRDDVSTLDIQEEEVLAIWEFVPKRWHAVLIREIKNGNVCYMDPKDGKEYSKCIKDFDQYRKPKRKSDNRKFLEILSPILKPDSDPHT